MQRLFTTFANGWPGLGLLIQRLVTGIALIHNGWAAFDASTIAPHAMGIALAILIMLGLWTPVAGALTAPIELWLALVIPDGRSNCILLATLGITLAMIGPGAFSIDARLFGRKRIKG